jgi:hypothetical protein
MKRLTIKRPKEKEKFYDESYLKIYINDSFVGKIQQNDALEIETDKEVIEIQAKTFGYKSSKMKIQVNGNNEIEVIRNHNMKNPLMITFILPLVFPVLYNTKIYWLKVTALSLVVIAFSWLYYIYLKERKNAIIINEIR